VPCQLTTFGLVIPIFGIVLDQVRHRIQAKAINATV
jgi:hypothetical protein